MRVINPADVLGSESLCPEADTQMDLGERDDLLTAPKANSPHVPVGRPPRILVAEDSPDIRRILSLFLRQAKFDHELVVNGRYALEKAIAEPFDLILMDMQMPEMDGYEATRALRERGFRIPIIAVTAHTLSGSREECLAAGCTDYLPKPINRRDLIELIQHYLNLAKPLSSSLVATT